LVEKLAHYSNVTVTFEKKDGTERVMNCTLQVSIVPQVNTESTRKENDDVVAVWDLEKDAWRSFRVDSIKSVEYR
jgi:hypothetical protein